MVAHACPCIIQLQDVIGNKKKKSGQFLRSLSEDFFKDYHPRGYLENRYISPLLGLFYHTGHFLGALGMLTLAGTALPVIDIFNRGGLWPSRNCKAAFTERLSPHILLRRVWGSWLE